MTMIRRRRNFIPPPLPGGRKIDCPRRHVTTKENAILPFSFFASASSIALHRLDSTVYCIDQDAVGELCCCYYSDRFFFFFFFFFYIFILRLLNIRPIPLSLLSLLQNMKSNAANNKVWCPVHHRSTTTWIRVNPDWRSNGVLRRDKAISLFPSSSSPSSSSFGSSISSRNT